MRNIFVLTKREQRVIIVVMLILVTAALANHYREKWRDSTARAKPPEPSITPALPTVRQEDYQEDYERGEPP
ncbi:MAG TPA: hypothetical protein VE758_06760 [Chthoniobacterales bacterium]|jgi:hypothetical protein|nr:hypothetical protein [Chthoniobacterales bacterium]